MRGVAGLDEARLAAIIKLAMSRAQVKMRGLCRHRRFRFNRATPPCALAHAYPLLERDLREAAQLPAVQLIDAGRAQQLDGAHADAQVLVDALAIEVIGHAGQLDLAMQGIVADAE